MLLKGILLGILFAAISVYLFFWFFWQPIRERIPAGAGPTAIDIRIFTSPAISFFGGMVIGFVIVLTLIFGGMHAFKLYMLHRFAQLQRS